MACCGAGFSAGKFIAAIVAVGLGGFAAYNYATSGSLCSSCSSSKDAQAVQAVGAQTEGSADSCPMGGGCDMMAKDAEIVATGGAHGACSGEGACPMSGEGVQEVANTDGATTGPCGKPCDGGACDEPCGACAGGACPHQQAEDEVASNTTEKSDG